MKASRNTSLHGSFTTDHHHIWRQRRRGCKWTCWPRWRRSRSTVNHSAAGRWTLNVNIYALILLKVKDLGSRTNIQYPDMWRVSVEVFLQTFHLWTVVLSGGSAFWHFMAVWHLNDSVRVHSHSEIKGYFSVRTRPLITATTDNIHTIIC